WNGRSVAPKVNRRAGFDTPTVSERAGINHVAADGLDETCHGLFRGSIVSSDRQRCSGNIALGPSIALHMNPAEIMEPLDHLRVAKVPLHEFARCQLSSVEISSAKFAHA